VFFAVFSRVLVSHVRSSFWTDPTVAIFYANRAAVYTKMQGAENFELAAADCQEAIALDPGYAKAYSRLGLALYHLGRYEEA
jgi:small glutamine-rich tetratricopeptide repeat-containing protein alpha